MCIDRAIRTFASTALMVMAVVGVSMHPAAAQTVDTPTSLAEHQQIDAAMGMLSGPVWRPVWFNRDNAPGALSTSPFYKQQPSGSQDDFRVQVAPVTPVVAPPAPRQPDRPDTSSNDNPEPEIVEPDPPQNEPEPNPPPPGNNNCQMQLILC